jgi:flagellar biosynthetic protein FliR
MPASLTLSTGTLLGFLLVLARVSGIFVFVPLPGMHSAPEPARIALVLGITMCLFPRWPQVGAGVSVARLIGWVIAEAAIGLAIGVAVAVVLEAFVLAAQVLGLQAGYAYASTIDPNTQADSGILLVIAQLISGMLFFALGFDREVIRLVAGSLQTAPAGAWEWSRGSTETLIRLSGTIFSAGLRLAFPVVALLLITDFALALLGRLNAHLQLLSLAFPVKMLLTLAMMAAGAAVLPRLLRELSTAAWSTLHHIGL